MEPPRWKIITPSQYQHERNALHFVRAGLPDHDPYRAWTNFEFQTDDGAIYIYEVGRFRPCWNTTPMSLV